MQRLTDRAQLNVSILIAIDCWKRLLRLSLLLCQILVQIFACRFCRAKFIVTFNRTMKLFLVQRIFCEKTFRAKSYGDRQKQRHTRARHVQQAPKHRFGTNVSEKMKA